MSQRSNERRDARWDTLRKMALALVIAGLAPFAHADCEEPDWYGDEKIKRPKGDLVGFGQGEAVDKARLGARRELARQIVQRRSKILFALPAVKGTVNTKVYTREELSKAMVLAVAYNLREAKRFKFATVCNKEYVAFTVNEVKAMNALKQAADLGEHVNLAVGGRIDALEAERQAQEVTAAEQEFAAPEAAVKRVQRLIQTLNRDDFIEPLLAEPLRRKVDKMEAKIKAARGMPWSDQRTKALDELQELTVQSEKLSTAVREWQKQSYVSAFEIFHSLATASDETAQFVTGMMYVEAKGVKRDYKEAMSWLRRAAAQGHGPAKWVIGTLTLSGHGTKPDANEAKKWVESGITDGWQCEATVVMCRKR